MSRERKFRKRPVADASPEASEGEAEDAPGLHDTWAQQRQRKRKTGISTDSLMEGAVDRSDVLSRVPVAGKDSDELLTSYVREEKREVGTADPEMEKFIEEQMEQRLGRKRAADPAAQVTEADRDEQDLYVTPEELKGQQINVTDGSAYMTGVLEVPLSISYKMHNIEDTEKAKRKLLSKSARVADGRDDDDEDEDGEDARGRRRELRGGVHRAVYPRNFGRVTAQDLALRQDQIRKFDTQPFSEKHKRR
ncbi:hypothetical protein WJX73_007312 [Symbiochloris irregularis]|uniref:Hepatocellular carcinoma-associated antigen 59 n=1 Tax=Symbiochloris irregularis TaxID=706552 RepID=A0AAW1PPG0_9CHLO